MAVYLRVSGVMVSRSTLTISQRVSGSTEGRSCFCAIPMLKGVEGAGIMSTALVIQPYTTS